MLASASLVDCDALIHIFGMKTIGPDQDFDLHAKPRRITLCAAMVRNWFQGVAMMGLDSMFRIFLNVMRGEQGKEYHQSRIAFPSGQSV